MDNGSRPNFPRPFGKGHWGSLGLPTRESTAADGTVAHFSGCSRMHSNNRIHSYGRIHSNSRIHNRTTGYTAGTSGYMAGLQDMHPNRIRDLTTGYTAKNDTWLDYSIHSQTRYVAGLQDTQSNRIRGHTTAAAPYSSRNERQTYRSRTEARMLLRFAFSSYNRNRRKTAATLSVGLGLKD